jgi:hypothetical protein
LTGNKLCQHFDIGKLAHGQPAWWLLSMWATSREACGSEKLLAAAGGQWLYSTNLIWYFLLALSYFKFKHFINTIAKC